MGSRIAAALVLCTTTGAAAPVELDRTVVRFVASETGGVASPRFIFERELAFEARLEALADRSYAPSAAQPYRVRHLRAALERHVAETVLEALEIDPPPTEADISARIEAARVALYERVGGALALEEAARAEGVDRSELLRMLRRQARASLYLDRMVAPMLEPSDAELRHVHRTQRTPFSGRPYEQVAPVLRRWYVSERLSGALASFFEGARSRLKLTVLESR